MLEDELVYVLSTDQELKKLFVIENSQSISFIRKLTSKNCRFKLLPLDNASSKKINSSMSTKTPNFLVKLPLFGKLINDNNEKRRGITTLVVNILNFGLHVDCEFLRSEIYRSIREMAEFSDGILLFYGNCGHSLKSLEADFKGLDCSFYFLKDKKGDIVEDCISVALGGNDNYAKTMQTGTNTGMFYLTPMWAFNWKEMIKDSVGSYDFNKSALKSPLYQKLDKRVIKINNGISKGEEFGKNVLEFARTFDMHIVEMEGSMDIARKSYLYARNNVHEKASQIQKSS
jgi:hypothetical protein